MNLPIIQLLEWAAIIIGAGIFLDGIGSVLIRNGQFHNIWFDGERYIRAAAGLILLILGIITFFT